MEYTTSLASLFFFKESALPYGFIVMFLMGSHTHRDGREIL